MNRFLRILLLLGLISVIAIEEAIARSCEIPKAEISEIVPDDYPTASRELNDAIAMKNFELPDSRRSLSEPSRRVFYPASTRQDGSQSNKVEFLEEPALVVIIWGNGAAGVDCPDRYLELFEHWVSYGFVVVQERSGGKIDGSLAIPNRSLTLFRKWIEANSPDGSPDLTVIAAGKSRGGSQAHTFASSKATRDKVDGILCIGGCGFGPFLLAPPRAAYQPGLYLTGERDWADLKVRQAYSESGPDRMLFSRAEDNQSSPRHAFGTHKGHDNDPFIRLLTTDWLRCRFQGEIEACMAITAQKSESKIWQRVRTK